MGASVLRKEWRATREKGKGGVLNGAHTDRLPGTAATAGMHPPPVLEQPPPWSGRNGPE